MIVWLEGMAEACAGQVDHGSGQQSWTCQQDDGPGGLDKTEYRVTLTLVAPDALDIDAIVDQSRDEKLDINRTRGFLADGVAGSPATGAAGPPLAVWVAASLAAGGRRTVGHVTAVVSPFRRVTEIQLSMDPAATPSK